MNKTLKKTLKGLKPPKVPDRVKLLSLLAIILVVGAPALVSIIDDSINEDRVYYTAAHELKGVGSTVRISGVWEPLDDLSPSVNDGVWSSVLTPDQISGAEFVYMKYDTSALADGARHIEIRANLQKILLIFAGAGSSDSRVTLTSNDGVFKYTLDSLLSVQFQTGAFDKLTISAAAVDNELPSLLEFELLTGGDYTIPYAEIIIGATGAVLLLCALLATPYFGVFKKKKGVRQ